MPKTKTTTATTTANRAKRTCASESDFHDSAAEVYAQYATTLQATLQVAAASLFVDAAWRRICRQTLRALLDSARKLRRTGIRRRTPSSHALDELLTKTHPNEKVLVFTQFADTVDYLRRRACGARSRRSLAAVTGDSPNPTARRLALQPRQQRQADRDAQPSDELRVLIATDVLSEGQNLQDCSIVVNYDLPWAIIRLIQRAGRVDRIGQTGGEILCYSFLPADGVERIIRLRARVRQRLRENAEVVGTDEAFFEDDADDRPILDLYHEKSGILDGDADTEVDLASYAYQIWKNAIEADPACRRRFPSMPNVVYSTKDAQRHGLASRQACWSTCGPAEGNDALAWIDDRRRERHRVAARDPQAPPSASPRRRPLLAAEHTTSWSPRASRSIAAEEKTVGGQLGRPQAPASDLRAPQAVRRGGEGNALRRRRSCVNAIEEIYRYPLRQVATDTLNRQLESGIADDAPGRLVVALREDGRLCLVQEDDGDDEPQIICSLGLVARPGGKP